jgi:hypothetical protein
MKMNMNMNIGTSLSDSGTGTGTNNTCNANMVTRTNSVVMNTLPHDITAIAMDTNTMDTNTMDAMNADANTVHSLGAVPMKAAASFQVGTEAEEVEVTEIERQAEAGTSFLSMPPLAMVIDNNEDHINMNTGMNTGMNTDNGIHHDHININTDPNNSAVLQGTTNTTQNTPIPTPTPTPAVTSTITAENNSDDTNDSYDNNSGQPQQQPKKKRKQYTNHTNPTNPEKSYNPINVTRKIYKLNKQVTQSNQHAILCPQLSQAYSTLNKYSQEKETIQKNIKHLQDEILKFQQQLQKEEQNLVLNQELIESSQQHVSNLEMKIPCTWNENYEKLKVHFDIHGHIDLPSRYHEDDEIDKLCTWLQRQKAQYKAYCDGSKKTQKPYRVIALEKLGVNWTVRDDKWGIQYDKLIKFKKDNGHTLVPTKAYPDKNFAHWVAAQRHEYKRMNEGKKNTLTPERIEQLKKAGFVFNVFDQRWEELFQALVEFRDANGHTNVPERYTVSPPLVKWVERQRMEYQLFINGESSSKRCRMTEDRIKRLKDIGFCLT